MAKSIRSRNLYKMTKYLSQLNSDVVYPKIFPNLTSSTLFSKEKYFHPSVVNVCRFIHRSASRVQQQVTERGPDMEPLDPLSLASRDLGSLFDDIKKDLRASGHLQGIANYYFTGTGKCIRPVITILMARAINHHISGHDRVTESQCVVAKVSEMIHNTSLLHDDVIDAADTRRGKSSANALYGQRKAIMAGDYVLGIASALVARIHHEEVVICLAQVLADLVQGEIMQLGSKEDENERFAHYLQKTYKKTASLIAYSCKAVALLASADEELQELAYQYGRNVGMAFQIVDDILDFVASSSLTGKNSGGADLQAGLATAPVLFSCNKFQELNPMIMRRFQEPGDVERALELVRLSDGLEQSRFLARQHCKEAIHIISSLRDSPEQRALMFITDRVLNRLK